MGKSDLEETFAVQIRALKLPVPVREYRFCERRWKVDFCWPEHATKLAVEIEGGVWVGGRHNRPSGFIKDMTKYNRLAKLGFTLLRFDGGSIKNGTAIKEVEEILNV